MEKNVASQKWIVFAYGLPNHANPGEPVTGDAGNITANLRLDGGDEWRDRFHKLFAETPYGRDGLAPDVRGNQLQARINTHDEAALFVADGVYESICKVIQRSSP